MGQPAQQLIAPVVVDDRLDDNLPEHGHARREPGRNPTAMQRKIGVTGTASHTRESRPDKLRHMQETQLSSGESDTVLVLTTGGTIDKQYFDATSEYQISDSVIPRLLANARVTQRYEFEELLHKDSLDLTDEDRGRIVERVRRSVCARVVVTHGTDTMTRTAEALTALSGKTIVLTGALAPARFHESDAAFNLGMAFATAQAAPPGVYITMNGSVFRASEVRKDRERQQFVRR